MVLLDMFYYNVSIKYKSTLCSKATLLVLISSFIIIFTPLPLIYRSRGFWLKSYTFYEQPDVRFKYQYFLIVETDNVEDVISCGNMPNITNTEITEDCFMINVREEDYNGDNKIDEIHFTIKVLNNQKQKFHAVKLFLILDYKLSMTCPLQMESMVVLSNSFGLPVSKHFVTANLRLSQVLPLPCWSNYQDTRYNYSVIPNYNEVTVGSWINDLVYSYSRRNVSTTLQNIFTNTVYGISDHVEVSVSLAIPESTIRYKPGISQELKHFWQQYISIAIIFYWIMYKINAYIFTNRLIPAWERTPWKKML